MDRGKWIQHWDSLANMMAMHANLNRDPKKRSRPYTPAEFSPFDELGNVKEQGPASSAPLIRSMFESMKNIGKESNA